MSSLPILCLDVDDCVHPFQHPRFAHHVERITGHHYPYEQHVPYACEFLNITKDQELEAVYAVYDDPLFWDQVPMDDAIQNVPILAQHYRVVALTQRPADIRHSTDEWLNLHFPGLFYDLIFVGLTGTAEFTRSKVEYARDHNAVGLVDDRANHLVGCHAAGIQGFLRHHPWNKDVKDHEDFIRVPDLGGVVAHLLPSHVA